MSASLELDDKALNVALRGQNLSEAEKVEVLNGLLNSSRLLVTTNERGIPVYRYQSEELAKKMRDMDSEDYAVYEKIEEARDRGITAGDLKNKLQHIGGFNPTVLSKVLKRLEKGGHVKKLKSLQQKNKQVYMIMEVEPSSEVTGGLANHEAFDLEAIEVMQERVLQYLKAKGPTSYREIALHVKQLGLMS